MEIVPATILDLNALRRLEHVCFDKDAWSLFDLIAVLSWVNVVRFKALENGEMVGFVAGETRQADGSAWIATICVDPRFQRRGMGRALLRACEARIPQARIKLTVRVSNQNAIALYEKEGYRTVDIWRRYYRDGEDGVIMEKSRQAA